MIDLGYEIGSGKRVSIPVNHTVVLGQTQLSGKTTTLEAMVTRSDLRAIGFITKPGEKSFRLQTQIPAFFSESTGDDYWKHVVAMLEYRSGVILGWRERGVVIKLCQDYKKEGSRIGFDKKTNKSKRERMAYSWKAPKCLRDVLDNLDDYLPYARSSEEMILIQLREFLRPVLAEIEKTEFSDKLVLARGINVMDITELSDGLKALVIRSVIEWVHKHGRKIVVIIPEAWKFIPERRSTPVKLALEGLIREGAGVGNFVWMDSQDLRGVDKLLLRSVIVWLFGVQRQRNEVAMTLDSIPDHPKPSATQIMQLGKGEFYVCHGTTLTCTYVQPAGMEDEHAKAIALGEEEPESWKGIAAALNAETVERDSPDEAASHQELGSADVPGHASPTHPGESTVQETGGSPASLPLITEDSEDLMWKEKFEELKAKYDALLLQMTPPAIAAQPSSAQGGIPPAALAAEKNGNMDLDGVYRYILDRAAKEKPASLAVLLERPEITVTFTRETINVDGKTVAGGAAFLISKGFFDRPTNPSNTIKELRRLGYSFDNKSVPKRLNELVSKGFLTREEGGEYLAVPGMKIRIQENA